MKSNEELQRRVAWLESRLDQVETELVSLNSLLEDCGFPNGIHTLKSTINDLLEEAEDLYHFPSENDDEVPPTQTFNPFA